MVVGSAGEVADLGPRLHLGWRARISHRAGRVETVAVSRAVIGERAAAAANIKWPQGRTATLSERHF